MANIARASNHRKTFPVTGFICNNFYHLYIAKSIADAIEGEKHLYLISDLPSLSDSPDATSDCWTKTHSYPLNMGVKRALKTKNADIRSLQKIFSRSHLDHIIFFVDKNIIVQLFLQSHPKSNKILIEEGIGLYDPTHKIILRNVFLKILFATKFGIHIRFNGTEQAANGYHDHLILRDPALLPAQKRNGILHAFNEAVSTEGSEKTSTLVPKSSKVNSTVVLIIGSDTSKIAISEREEAGLFELALGELGHAPLKVFIKPHPKENLSKYSKLETGYTMLQTEKTAETISQDLRLDYAISLMSSALLNISNLHQKTTSIYLSELTDKKFPNKETIKKIKKPCNVLLPENNDQLNRLIKATIHSEFTKADSDTASIVSCVKTAMDTGT